MVLADWVDRQAVGHDRAFSMRDFGILGRRLELYHMPATEQVIPAGWQVILQHFCVANGVVDLICRDSNLGYKKNANLGA